MDPLLPFTYNPSCSRPDTWVLELTGGMQHLYSRQPRAYSPGICGTAQGTDAIKRLFGSEALAKHSPHPCNRHESLSSRDMVLYLLLRLSGRRSNRLFSVSHLQVHTGDIKIRPLRIRSYLRCHQAILFLSPFKTRADKSYHLPFHLG